MKRENILKCFDKAFNGRVDNEIFDRAKGFLTYINIGNKSEIKNIALKEFTKAFYEMRAEVEKSLISEEEYVHSDMYANSKIILKIRHQKYLENLRKQYEYIGKFTDLFYEFFKVSLVEIKDSLDREAKLKKNKQIKISGK